MGLIVRAGERLNRRQFGQQLGQRCFNRLPDYFEIDVEVAVCDAVSHAAHASPRDSGLLSRERGVTIHDVGRRFAHDDEAHDHRLLRAFVGEKIRLGHAFDKAASVSCRLMDVLQ